jgi:hypothetical protein
MPRPRISSASSSEDTAGRRALRRLARDALYWLDPSFGVFAVVAAAVVCLLFA